MCRFACMRGTHGPRFWPRSASVPAASPPEWREGVRWDDGSQTDLFAFTLDKSEGEVLADDAIPRLRDQLRPLFTGRASRRRPRESPVGQRYINHEARGTNVVLFCPYEVERPGVLVSRPCEVCAPRGKSADRHPCGELDHRLPADLFTEFAAAAA